MKSMSTYTCTFTSGFHGLCVSISYYGTVYLGVCIDLSPVARSDIAQSHRIWVQLKLLLCSETVIVYTNVLVLTAVPNTMYLYYPNSKNKLKKVWIFNKKYQRRWIKPLALCCIHLRLHIHSFGVLGDKEEEKRNKEEERIMRMNKIKNFRFGFFPTW